MVKAGRPVTSMPVKENLAADLAALLAETRRIAERAHFLHWELTFPSIWQELNNEVAFGGFDAVIGNPPWDRIKLQEVEWFAGRRETIAKAQRAADRKRLIDELARANDPLHAQYKEAQGHAELLSAVVRSNGQFPLLARGDVNLYSLCVERAARLVAPKGLVGLLVPSGIAADQSASEFFKSVASTGRLNTLFDFENRRSYLPSVHKSFKFCTCVFAGRSRRSTQAECSFYLHDVEELAEENRVSS